MLLDANRFSAFFEGVHGYPPFPWQERLAATVLANGWPPCLALPTASGKTACMDIAVFALAAGGMRRETRQPRRIFFVIDRRIVVDEAYERARRIVASLQASDSGIVAVVAASLGELSAGGPPLAAAVLRGGIYRDDRWTSSPVQPTIVVGTVDQIGSRLLHRGYGVSPFGWPIHTGLIGNDSVIFLDEAHCSQPFASTLEWIKHYRSAEWASLPLDLPFAVVEMTATPTNETHVFRADERDWAHPVLGRRLAASKPATLVVARPKQSGFVSTVVIEASRLSVAGAATTAVVVNRVATARSVFAALQERTDLDADVILLMGRARPADRDALLAEYGARLVSSRRRDASHRRLIVVATQCIEVGADLDFDAMVTECCPIDALRQRFGRLNRLGLCETALAAVVVRKEQTESSKDDPVYGVALARTWAWLQQRATAEGHATVDMGVRAIEAWLDAAPEGRERLLAELRSPSLTAPVVLPSHCDAWAQTFPAPHVCPDPAAYLHGVGCGLPDVQIVWRSDLPETESDAWQDIVAMCPPGTTEAISVPLHAARAWLSGRTADLVDVEGARDDDGEDEQSAERSRPALKWRGPDSDETSVVFAPTLSPDDLLVVPASYGGCDRFGWHPESTSPVADLGDELRAARRRAILRLHPAVVAGWLPADSPIVSLVETLVATALTETVDAEAVLENLEELANADVPRWVKRVARHLAADRRIRVASHPSGAGAVLWSARLLPAGDSGADFTDEDATASSSSREVTLADHLADTERHAAAMVRALRLQEDIAYDLVLAARLHDLGKMDPRFQIWLHQGDRLAAARTAELLAKSASIPTTPGSLAFARKLSGYPAGGRHELLSVRLAESSRELLSQALNPDLVLHLLASHHGRCRPFAPAVDDPVPELASGVVGGVSVAARSDTGLERLDSGVSARFWRLLRRFGWWGLALLEATLRLADQRASEEEQGGRE
ncbi:MAG: type I-U CRISPR-associated helicase/endonuclease Cas3 [Pseudomonadota bacterium]